MFILRVGSELTISMVSVSEGQPSSRNAQASATGLSLRKCLYL